MISATVRRCLASAIVVIVRGVLGNRNREVELTYQLWDLNSESTEYRCSVNST